MSSTTTTKDEWTVVTKNDKKCMKGGGGRKKHSNKKTVQDLVHNDGATASALDKPKVLEDISACVVALKRTDFYRDVVDRLGIDEETTRNRQRDIVCYGVGNFATQIAPRWQLACILCLRDALLRKNDETSNNDNDDERTSNVYFYDPCTTPLEHDILENDFGIHVLLENERGCRSVGEVDTLFVMPHCPQVLYNNVLVSNWGDDLKRITILGNSLHAYHAMTFRPTMSGIKLLLPCLQEYAVQCSKQDLAQKSSLETAFNDFFIVTVDEASFMSEELPSQAPSLVEEDDELL